ncbi:SAV_915 family protein [Streptomyces cinnamoneus]|uniref:SAV_915 family protein n=1 Tax=Streptomyces cinnamoneus TaxID=53446 RepID=UPI0015E392E6|nr:SAV_915 family protein [Streptomyces cinnamoneus]
MTSPILSDGHIVLAPARPHRGGHEGAEDGVVFETSRSATGERCGLAFTSTEALVSRLGPDQPWVALPIGALRHLLGETGISVVAVDPYIPAETP